MPKMATKSLYKSEIIFVCQAMEQEVVRTLEDKGIETKIVKRFQYNDEVVKWADLILTTGAGDHFTNEHIGGNAGIRRGERIYEIFMPSTNIFELNCFLCLLINLFKTIFLNRENKT